MQEKEEEIKVIRTVFIDISGQSPLGRKIIELLKQSKAYSQKKEHKVAIIFLGTGKRAQKKGAFLLI